MNLVWSSAILIFRTQYCLANITQPHVSTINILNDQIIEIFFRIQASKSSHCQFSSVAGNLSGRQFNILFQKGRLDIISRHPFGDQFQRIDPDTHSISFLAPDLDTADARNGLESFHEHVISVLCHLQRVSRITLYRH
jgi:hypothetical protein